MGGNRMKPVPNEIQGFVRSADYRHKWHPLFHEAGRGVRACLERKRCGEADNPGVAKHLRRETGEWIPIAPAQKIK